MADLIYIRLREILARFPRLHEFLDDDFVRKQCEAGLKNYLLKQLAAQNSLTEQHLPALEKRLAALASPGDNYSGAGYHKLGQRLRGVGDWDQYQEFLTQIDITLWFKQKALLKEIEPRLPHSKGEADILLSCNQQDIYCECTSFQSLWKSIQEEADSESDKQKKKQEKLKKEYRGLTMDDVTHKGEIDNTVRKLLDKTKNQLPSDWPAILALDTSKAAVYSPDIKEIARRLFPKRRHLVLIASWSWENSSQNFLDWERATPKLFVNSESKFPTVGKDLVTFLGLRGETV